ncbi:hypothetical protein ElP_74080 (plasmid) [Tautonia plasticadhaerens]|uniref:Uncharacterized protein n=1 Tax=Tautonia plasticadhaerens TaxID=2527974 RepID=A0A518HF42_9BACT|nr:hypothetical protein ElP_74080 [Tautonia plasticadhaerens]
MSRLIDALPSSTTPIGLRSLERPEGNLASRPRVGCLARDEMCRSNRFDWLGTRDLQRIDGGWAMILNHEWDEHGEEQHVRLPDVLADLISVALLVAVVLPWIAFVQALTLPKPRGSRRGGHVIPRPHAQSHGRLIHQSAHVS